VVVVPATLVLEVQVVVLYGGHDCRHTVRVVPATLVVVVHVVGQAEANIGCANTMSTASAMVRFISTFLAPHFLRVRCEQAIHRPVRPLPLALGLASLWAWPWGFAALPLALTFGRRVGRRRRLGLEHVGQGDELRNGAAIVSKTSEPRLPDFRLRLAR
jgi:hypothetical protein